MVKVTVGNNLKQKDVVVPQNTTLYDVLTQNGISTNTGFIQLNGQTIDERDITLQMAYKSKQRLSQFLVK